MHALHFVCHRDIPIKKFAAGDLIIHGMMKKNAEKKIKRYFESESQGYYQCSDNSNCYSGNSLAQHAAVAGI